MGKCYPVIYQTGEPSDSVTTALSKVLNLRLSTVRELLEILLVDHVNKTTGAAGYSRYFTCC